MLRSIVIAMLLASVAARASQPAAPASRAYGTIRGTVYDSLSHAVIAGAVVELESPARVVQTDRRGAFTIDSVPVGAHRLTFSAPALDSIGLFGFARNLDVREGDQRVALATPSFQTLYRSVCAPAEVATKDSAIVFGTVYDARTRRPAPGVSVQFSWYAMDASSGPQLLRVMRQATTDSVGNYGRCGLPDDLALQSQAASATSASGSIATVIGEARVLRRDLYVSDEFLVDSATGATRSNGSGMIRGTVRDEKGAPLVNALVVLLASDRTARTDSLGVYRFTGVPLGTQELSVRQVGRGALYRMIDVTGEAPLEESFTLPQSTVLATVNVRGVRRLGSDQAEYLARQRHGFGRYVNQAEIAKRPDMAAALQQIAGLNVRRGSGGLVVDNRRYGCQPLIVLDGFPESGGGGSSTIPRAGAATMPSGPSLTLDALNPRDVLAIEYYAGVAGMPLKYSFGDAPRCGMLLVWTVFSRW